MPLTDYNKVKKISPTSQNDAGATIGKAQPVLVNGTGLQTDEVDSGSSEISWNEIINSNSEVYGTYSVEFQEAAGNGGRNPTSLEREVRTSGTNVQASVKIDSDQSNFCSYLIYSPASTELLEIRFNDGNGNVEEVNSNTQILSSWSAGTIYDIEVVPDFSNNQADITINGTTVTSIPFASAADSFGRIGIENDNLDGSSTRSIFLDRYTYAEYQESDTGTGDIILDFANISDAQDIAVYDQNDNLLDYEIESLDTTNETGVLWCYNSWVRDDSVQAQVAYGSNSANTDRQNVTGTWGNTGQSAEMVQHLNESNYPSDTALDSTSNNHDGSVTGTSSTSGYIDGGGSFDGTDDFIDVGGTNKIPSLSSLHIVAYLNTDSVSTSQRAFSVKSNNRVASAPRVPASATFRFTLSDGSNFPNVNTGTDSVNTNTDYNVYMDWDGSTMGIALDGGNFENTTSFSGPMSDNNNRDLIGAINDGSGGQTQHWDGEIWGIRLYSESKSQAWRQADHDASPKAGQVYFSQQAAETTVTTTEVNFSQDVSIENRDVTQGFSQTVILENRNIPQQFTQDVALSEKDLTKTLDTDVAIQDRDVEKTFTQDVTLFDRDVEKTFNQDVSIVNLDQESSFSQDVIIRAGNEAPFTQDVVIEKRDVTKGFSQDLILENANIPEQFTQDVAIVDLDQETTFSQDAVLANLDQETTFSQDAVLSMRGQKTFENSVVIAKQPAPNVRNPLTVEVKQGTETFTKVLNPTNTYLEVEEVKKN